MPGIETDNQRTYSTGELARACGVTVRTVQYYDEKGLLPPSDLTEGGRRIYTQADAAKLRKVLLLKSLGLKLTDIRSFLVSDASSAVLRDILAEQEATLTAKLEEDDRARRRIAAMIASLDEKGELPAETVPDTEDIMQKQVSWRRSELAPMFKAMVAVGIAIGGTLIGVVAWGVATGHWRPFAVAMPAAIMASVLLIRSYRMHTACICPHCRNVFVPETTEWLYSAQKRAALEVTCTHCGTRGWCAEVSRKKLTT